MFEWYFEYVSQSAGGYRRATCGSYWITFDEEGKVKEHNLPSRYEKYLPARPGDEQVDKNNYVIGFNA